MLRDEKDVALNALLVACRKAAEHYRQAAEMAEKPQWAEMFAHRARLRHTDAGRIEMLLRRFGYLPGEPDRDRQDVSQLITLTRAAVTDDNAAPLRKKACQLEDDIEDRASEALAQTWPPEALDLLKELVQSSRDHRDALTAED